MQGENSFNALLIYLQEILFLEPAYLWYLMAVLISIIPFANFYRRKYIQYVIYAILAYFIGTLGNSYKELLGNKLSFYFAVFLTTRNGVFFAPIYLLVGGLLSKARTVDISLKKTVLLFIVSYSIFIFEVSFVLSEFPRNQDNSMYFSMPLVIYFLLKLLIDLSKKVNKDFSYHRKLSLSIYLMQFGLLTFFRKIFEFVGLRAPYNCFVGLTVVLFTVISSIFVMEIWKEVKRKATKFRSRFIYNRGNC